jgi:hypothetical protein
VAHRIRFTGFETLVLDSPPVKCMRAMLTVPDQGVSKSSGWHPEGLRRVLATATGSRQSTHARSDREWCCRWSNLWMETVVDGEGGLEVPRFWCSGIARKRLLTSAKPQDAHRRRPCRASTKPLAVADKNECRRYGDMSVMREDATA